MDWHLIILDGTDIEQNKPEQLLREFVRIYESKNTPKDFALFRRNDNTDSRYAFYLTPVASDYCSTLISRYTHGVPCDKPNMSEISWAAGDGGTWRLFATAKASGIKEN